MKPRFPLFAKITAASFLVVLVVLGFLSAVAYRDQHRAVEDKFGLTLQHVAETAALFVDGDAHQRIHDNADARGADFAALRATLERVQRANDLKVDQIYTLRPSDGGQLAFVVMLQPRTFVGDRFLPGAAAASVAAATLADGHARHTGIYTDPYGSFVSGFAAIRDRTGRVVGLLEVDYGVDRFLAEFRQEGYKRIWTLPAALLLALVLSLFVSTSLTRAVKQLVEGTHSVAAGRYDRPVDVRTRDELRTLADAFNRMLAGLRERFAIYLRAEAEIIERHGGSIDKYIGDAVMAIFEGADRYARAAASAVEIQGAAIARLNAEHAFDTPIDVGIGIAGGEVVMGSIGYEDRMEFAVIGRFVNLGSRLTGVAGKGEIVLSDAAFAALGDRFAGERIAEVKLKGFSAAQTCYKIRARG